MSLDATTYIASEVDAAVDRLFPHKSTLADLAEDCALTGYRPSLRRDLHGADADLIAAALPAAIAERGDAIPTTAQTLTN
jgi:hypothetical protein